MKNICIIIFLAFSSFASATTYYIDTNGNDATGNGSLSTPWKSLYKACNSVTTVGSIIHVNAGTYTETLQSVLRIGVSIEGAGNTSIILSHVTGAAYTYGGVPTILLSSNTEGTNGNQSISYIKMDGDKLTARSAIRIQRRSNVLIHHCEFVDFYYSGIIFLGAGGDGKPAKTWATGNKFYNNTVTNCSAFITPAIDGLGGYYGDGLWALGINGCDGMLVYNNTMTSTGRSPGLNGYVIKCVEGYNKNLKIYNNTLTRAPYVSSTPPSYDFAIEIWNNMGGMEVFNNNINGSIDYGQVAGTSLPAGFDYYLYVHDNSIGQVNLGTEENITGMHLEGTATQITIARNYFYNVCSGLFCNQSQANRHFEDVYIYCNIFDNIGVADGGSDYKGWGINFSEEDLTSNIIDNVNIWNNVFNGHIGARTNVWGIQVPDNGVVTNVSIRNNIVQNFDYAPIFASQSPNSNVSIDMLSVENNIFYNNGNSNFPLYSNITPTHYTVSNTITNPLFVSATDFHLKETSSAIGNGIFIGTPVLTDKDGVNWNKPPSIGAYEYPSSSGNNPPSLQDQGFRLNENSPNETTVGTVLATDPDVGQTLTYSIVSGNTNDAFALNTSTGEISVAHGAAVNVDYALVVKVQDNGVGELSSQATITISIIRTGIELTGNNHTIKVYPNPVSDELIIEYEGNTKKTNFEILNSTGQSVFKGNLSEKTVVQTTNFSPGVYFLKLQNGKSFEFKKIVKV
jgi:hypothetical protein